ncbi:MAG: TetR/AcrR family transcriptional regulator [Fusobacteriota bacterium]
MSKKEELIEIALELFAKEGYDNVGVKKIVERAGVKKPTLYYHFDNKEGVLQSILEVKFDNFFSKLNDISEYEGDITLTLEKIIFFYFDFAKKNTLFYRLIMSLSFAPEKNTPYKCMVAYLKRQYSILESVFLEAEKQHGNMKGRSEKFAFSYLGLINSGISFYFYTKNEEDISKDSARKLCKQFMHGIFS